MFLWVHDRIGGKLNTCLGCSCGGSFGKARIIDGFLGFIQGIGYSGPMDGHVSRDSYVSWSGWVRQGICISACHAGRLSSMEA